MKFLQCAMRTNHLILFSHLFLPCILLAGDRKDAPVSGVYHAEKIAASPHFKASGIAWWNGRLIISNRVPPQLYAFTPPDRFEVLKDLTHPVGVAVDPMMRLVFTEKEDKVLYRIARIVADGKEEDIVKEVDVDNKKPGPSGVGSPHFLAVHRNGTIYWSGFPNGGTRYLLPGSKKVIVATPKIVHTYGIGLSPQQDWLYVNSKIPNADRRGVWRFPVHEDGRLGKGEFFIGMDQFTTTHLKDLPPAKDGSDKLLGWVGRLQGLAVDRLGYIYVAGAESHHSGAAVAVFTPDGKKLAAMIVAQKNTQLGIPTNISGLAFGGQDGRTLFITGAGTYRLYRVRLPVSGTMVATTKHSSPPQMLRGHQGWVAAAAFSPDGNRIATAGDDGALMLWDAASGKQLARITDHRGGVSVVAFNSNGKHIVTGSWDHTLKLRDAGGKGLRTLKGHEENITCVAFSPDGKRLASGSGDDTFRVWDVATGKPLFQRRHGNEYDISALAYSPNGKLLVTADGDKIIKLWDALNGSPKATITGHQGAINCVAFSPDGKRFACGDGEKVIKVWDTVTGDEVMTLSGHTDNVTSLVYSSDGKRIFSGSDDQTVRIWNSATGKHLKTLRAASGEITSIALSPDGKRLAAASNAAVHLFDVLPTDK